MQSPREIKTGIFGNAAQAAPKTPNRPTPRLLNARGKQHPGPHYTNEVCSAHLRPEDYLIETLETMMGVLHVQLV